MTAHSFLSTGSLNELSNFHEKSTKNLLQSLVRVEVQKVSPCIYEMQHIFITQ